MTPFLFLLLSLGVARVTWLITNDHIPVVAKPRQWIVNRKPEGNLAYLVECWFCSGVYVSAGASAFAVWVLNMNMDLADWKAFLVLWPAFAWAGLLLMALMDVLLANGEDDA